ncbi:MAG: polysaccharide pyruvyl transferase family protein [Cyanobacteria bacterium J06634_6]
MPSKNFGDELNPWLWPRLLPSFDKNSKNIFIGIGTVLNDAIPQWVRQADNVIFFSSGAGYGRRLRARTQPNWKIYCVRGPLSAQRLALPSQLAITDGAALLKRYFAPVATTERRYEVSYMPHFRHGSPQLFKEICARAGIHFIDPAGEVESVIEQISHSQLLISEAMHGAIVADTLRVPWIPVRTSPRILPFKWKDWCRSVNLPYQPQIVRGVRTVPVQDYRYSLRLYFQRQASIRSLLDDVSMTDSRGYVKTFKGRASETLSDSLCRQLLSITRKMPYLSDEGTLDLLVARLEERLETLKQDIGKGSFCSAFS